MRRSLIMLIVVLALSTGARAQVDPSTLPPCWTITSSYTADPASLEGFSARFGADLEALYNDKIDAAGLPLQVNTVLCATPEDGQDVYDYFMSAREATRQKYIRRGDTVYEFLCDNYAARAKMHHILGLGKQYERAYTVRVEVAPLAGGDDMRWNALYNALLSNDEPAIDSLAASFRFSDTLSVRGGHPAWGAPEYTFSVDPVARVEHGDVVEMVFSNIPRTGPVPRVAMEATVPVKAFAAYRPDKPVNAYRLTRSTRTWPTDDPAVLAALEGIDPAWPAAKKIEHIVCWVAEHIRYGGEVTGSRYGVPAVLAQGFGHCWDMADVFVTLCRASGVPAREVMGWHIKMDTGHVWAQAWDDLKGWVSVDATTSWTGITERYIPLFILDDGEAPFVYASRCKWTLAGLEQ